MKPIFKFDVNKSDGESQSLSEYAGNVILIVNTASSCGFTPQFEELQELYDTYNVQGLTILGFPCDQFNNQEFDDIEETLKFCQANYGVTFPMFAKIDVKGYDAHPLFTFLQKEAKGILSEAIKWNFTKFLVDRQGNVINRYAPVTKPKKFEKDIIEALEAKAP